SSTELCTLSLHDALPISTEANAQLVQGAGTVWVAVDERERDEHGRLLGYVFADGVFVNEELVARGLAEVMIVEPNVRYAEELLRSEEHTSELQSRENLVC